MKAHHPPPAVEKHRESVQQSIRTYAAGINGSYKQCPIHYSTTDPQVGPDRTRPDQTRLDQTKPDQIRLDQTTGPDQTRLD